jgi:hypothetical protein
MRLEGVRSGSLPGRPATQGIDCLQRQKKTKKAAVARCLHFLLKPDGKAG